MIRKTIALSDDMGDWITRQLASGRYNNESEYVRDLIRRDQDDQLKLEYLRAMIARGRDDLSDGKYQELDGSEAISELLGGLRQGRRS